MNDKDLIIDEISNIKGFWIRITHKPTGEKVTGSGKSSWNLKRDLKKELKEKLS